MGMNKGLNRRELNCPCGLLINLPSSLDRPSIGREGRRTCDAQMAQSKFAQLGANVALLANRRAWV